MDHILRDLRYAARTLGRTPAFTAVAALTLALGIGANTAMFSVVYGILLRPLPYRDAGRLALIQREQDLSGAHRPVTELFFSQADIEAWRSGLRTFEATAVYSTEVAALATDQGSDVVDTAVVSGTFFSTLAGPIAAGRPLDRSDDLTPTIVISDRLSRVLFASPQDAVGRRLTLSSRAYTIAGVADPRFQFPTAKTDAWIPSGYMRTVNVRCCWFRMFGRLKPGAAVGEAAAEAATLTKASSPADSAARSDRRATVVILRDQIVGGVRAALLVLFAAVGLVLLVACVNIVNLLLARQVARSRDAAIRRALGASRGRLVSQSLAEVAVLASIGVAMGVVLAFQSVRVLQRWQPPGVPRLDAVHVDGKALLFSIGIAVLATIAAGVLPAWRSAASTAALTSGAAAAAGAPGNRRVRRVLCAAELAVSLVLLVGATLLGRSLVRLMSTDLGVTTDHVVTASLNLALGARPTDAQTLDPVERVIDRIATLPGVRAVGAGTSLPPNASRVRLTLRPVGDAVGYQASGVAATPGYFRALGIRLVAGRLFTEEDDDTRPQVMIMSADTAKRFFGDGNPIGRTTTLPTSRNGVNGQAEMTLVGVIANVKYAGLDVAADDAVYRPFRQQTWPSPFLVAQTATDPQTFAGTLRREIGAVDRGMVVADVRPLDAVVADAAAQPRFRTVLLASIAALALAMAIVGLYGVVAYSVAQRTKEIGIHMALGARGADVLQMVLREGVALAAAGIAGGLAMSAAATRTLEGLMYGIAPTDAASYVLASAGLFGVALVASYLPARRATKVDPLVALRQQ